MPHRKEEEKSFYLLMQSLHTFTPAEAGCRGVGGCKKEELKASEGESCGNFFQHRVVSRTPHTVPFQGGIKRRQLTCGVINGQSSRSGHMEEKESAQHQFIPDHRFTPFSHRKSLMIRVVLSDLIRFKLPDCHT